MCFNNSETIDTNAYSASSNNINAIHVSSDNNQSIQKYIINVRSIRETTARIYIYRLNKFSSIILTKYNDICYY
jgi:hypothetical protein